MEGRLKPLALLLQVRFNHRAGLVQGRMENGKRIECPLSGSLAEAKARQENRQGTETNRAKQIHSFADWIKFRTVLK